MNGKRLAFNGCILLLLFPVHARAQLPDRISLGTEEVLFNDEEVRVPLESFENQEDAINCPLNLNSATTAQLNESGLFTPYQVHTLIKYREQFGTFFSIYELAGIAGFRTTQLLSIEPYLSVEAAPAGKPVKSGKQLILVNTGLQFPATAGFQTGNDQQTEPSFAGNQLKTSFRLKKEVGSQFSIGLSYEKDPGEQYFQEQRPEFLSGYLMFRGNKWMEQLIVGNYQLHHGLGLVNGTGFLHSPGTIRPDRSSLSGLKPYASVNEYRFDRGIAGKIRIRNGSILLWTSCRQIDLSLENPAVNDLANSITEHQRKTGLHRTMNELNGRNLGFRSSAGIQTLIHQGNFAIGSVVGLESDGLSEKGQDSLGVSLKPTYRGILSIHGYWYRNRFELYGEITGQKKDSRALLTELRFHFSEFFMGTLTCHRYDPGYNGFQPSSYASGSTIRNERGFTLGLKVEPGKVCTADLLVELFEYPAPRYLCKVPSTGIRYSCLFSGPENRTIQWRVKFYKRVWQTTPASESTGIRPVTSSTINRQDIRIIYKPDGLLKWQGRIVASMLSREEERSTGFAAVQQISIHPIKPLSATAQFVVFHITEWENRIYLYEPGLFYDFNFPVLYGTGQKAIVVCSLKAGRSVTFSGKASMITYHDRQKTGSGNNQMNGNKKWELELQVRWLL